MGEYGGDGDQYYDYSRHEWRSHAEDAAEQRRLTRRRLLKGAAGAAAVAGIVSGGGLGAKKLLEHFTRTAAPSSSTAQATPPAEADAPVAVSQQELSRYDASIKPEIQPPTLPENYINRAEVKPRVEVITDSMPRHTVPDAAPEDQLRPLEALSENADYGELLTHLEALRDHPFFNPPLYRYDIPEQARKDVLDETLAYQKDKLIAGMHYLLHSFTGNIYTAGEPLPEGMYRLQHCLDSAGDVLVSIYTGEQGYDQINSRAQDYLDSRINDLLRRTASPEFSPAAQSDYLGQLSSEFGAVSMLYHGELDEEPEEADVRKKFADLVQDGVFDRNDPSLQFLLSLTKFYDPRATRAYTGLLNKIIAKVTSAKGKNLSCTDLWNQYSDVEMQLYPHVFMAGIDPAVRKDIDWASFGEACKNSEVQASCAEMTKWNESWEHVLAQTGDREVPMRYADGIEVYGEDQPCSEEDLIAIYKTTAGGLYDDGHIPTDEEIMKYRESILRNDKRRVEFVLPQSVWEGLKKQIPSDLPTEQWFQMHMDELTKMFAKTKPEVPMQVVTARVMILEDGLIEKQAEKFGIDKDRLVALENPDTDRTSFMYQQDNISPWSLDVQGRWVYPRDIFANTGYKVTRTLENGDTVTLDSGMLHEMSHQIFQMSDMYNFNTADNPDQDLTRVKNEAERVSGHRLPQGFMRVELDGGYDGGCIIPALRGGDAYFDYSWPEMIRFLQTKTKYPEFIETLNRAKFTGSSDLGMFDVLENRSVVFRAISDTQEQLLSCTAIPFWRDKAVESVPLQLQGDKSVRMEARDFFSNFVHPDRYANAMLLQFKNVDGQSMYLPMPRNLIDDGFCAADLEGKGEIAYDIEFFQPPLQGDNYDQLQRLNLYLLPEEAYVESRALHKEDLYATARLQFQGKDYYAFWVSEEAPFVPESVDVEETTKPVLSSTQTIH